MDVMTTINSLPVELLAAIFFFVQDEVINDLEANITSNMNFPFVLAATCSCWRAVSLGLPDLWSYIYVHRPVQTPSTRISQIAQRLRFHFDRSLNVSLHLNLILYGVGTSPELDMLWLAIREQLHRCASLTLKSRYASMMGFLPLPSSGRLEAVTLEFGAICHSQGVFAPQASYPRMRSLELKDCWISPLPNIPLHELRVSSSDRGAGPSNLIRVANSLARWPNSARLQALTLTDVPYRREFPSVPTFLPLLSSLRIQDGPIARFIAAPNLARLESEGFGASTGPYDFPLVEHLMIYKSSPTTPSSTTLAQFSELKSLVISRSDLVLWLTVLASKAEATFDGRHEGATFGVHAETHSHPDRPKYAPLLEHVELFSDAVRNIPNIGIWLQTKTLLRRTLDLRPSLKLKIRRYVVGGAELEELRELYGDRVEVVWNNNSGW